MVASHRHRHAPGPRAERIPPRGDLATPATSLARDVGALVVQGIGSETGASAPECRARSGASRVRFVALCPQDTFWHRRRPQQTKKAPWRFYFAPEGAIRSLLVKCPAGLRA